MKMLQQGLSQVKENTSNPCLRKKTTTEKSKGLKLRVKALSDVKNTIHSHSSTFNVEKRKKSGKYNEDGSKTGCEKLIKTEEYSKCSTAKEGDNMMFGVDVSEPEYECVNHFMCEKANNFYHAEFLDEYKLTKNEIERFGSRRNFFSIDPVPLKLNTLLPVEDVELGLTYVPVFDEDIIEDIETEVPPPPNY